MTSSEVQERINGLKDMLAQREAVWATKSDETKVSLQKCILSGEVRTKLVAALISLIEKFVPTTEKEVIVKLAVIKSLLEMQEEVIDTVSNASTGWEKIITGDQRSALTQEASTTAVMGIVSTNA